MRVIVKATLPHFSDLESTMDVEFDGDELSITLNDGSPRKRIEMSYADFCTISSVIEHQRKLER